MDISTIPNTCTAKSFLDMYFFVMPDRAPKIMLDDQKQKPFCRNLRHFASNCAILIGTCIVSTNLYLYTCVYKQQREPNIFFGERHLCAKTVSVEPVRDNTICAMKPMIIEFSETSQFQTQL